MSACESIGLFQLLCSQEVAFQGVIGRNIIVQVPYSLMKNLDGVIKKNSINVAVFLLVAFNFYATVF